MIGESSDPNLFSLNLRHDIPAPNLTPDLSPISILNHEHTFGTRILPEALDDGSIPIHYSRDDAHPYDGTKTIVDDAAPLPSVHSNL